MTVGTHDRGGIPAHPDGACSAPNVGVLFSLKNSAGACDVGMGRASCTFELSHLSVFTMPQVLMTAWFHADGRTLSTGDALPSVASAPGGLVSRIIRPMVENGGDGVSCKGEETHHE